jgi:hypothetical protein
MKPLFTDILCKSQKMTLGVMFMTTWMHLLRELSLGELRSFVIHYSTLQLVLLILFGLSVTSDEFKCGYFTRTQSLLTTNLYWQELQKYMWEKAESKDPIGR